MTRKQAEKVAAEIVALAKGAGNAIGDPSWTLITFAISDRLCASIDENIGLVVGCLPMGWRLTGERFANSLTVARRGS